MAFVCNDKVMKVRGTTQNYLTWPILWEKGRVGGRGEVPGRYPLIWLKHSENGRYEKAFISKAKSSPGVLSRGAIQQLMPFFLSMEQTVSPAAVSTLE